SKPATPPGKPPGPGGPPPPPKPDDTPTLEVEPDNTNPPPPTSIPVVEIAPEVSPEGGKEKDLTLAEKHVSWQDIVVVMRKPFLKQGRFELIPSWGVTLNDNMIRHIEFNGRVSYWLTDVLAVGVEGQLFGHQFLEPYDLVARDYRRLPTLNQYNWAGSIDF